jgi:hypothetical protein
MHGSNRYRAPHPCPDCGSGPLSGTLYCPPVCGSTGAWAEGRTPAEALARATAACGDDGGE